MPPNLIHTLIMPLLRHDDETRAYSRIALCLSKNHRQISRGAKDNLLVKLKDFGRAFSDLTPAGSVNHLLMSKQLSKSRLTSYYLRSIQVCSPLRKRMHGPAFVR